MSGRIYPSKSGDYDLWIPESPQLPELEQFQQFRENRIRLSDRYPGQCGSCLAVMKFWDNPAETRGRKDGKEQVSSTSITIGAKVQRLELNEIRTEGRIRPLHMMTWLISPMTFKVKGCPSCQSLMMRLQAQRPPAEIKSYRPIRNQRQAPLRRHLCPGCKQSFLGVKCHHCGWDILKHQDAKVTTTWREYQAYIDLTDELKRG